MGEVLQQLVNGLALGSIYALIALGYTMVYGIVKLINFAHGDVLMIGAFAGLFSIIATSGNENATVGSLAIALLLAMIVCALIGMFIEITCYKPLRNAPRINALITAIGVSLFLENGARLLPFIGPNPKQYPRFSNSFLDSVCAALSNMLKVTISPVDVIVFVVSILLMVLLYILVNHTKTGKAMRAVSYDTKAASLMGINVNHIISFTFAIGSALAAAAGILYASKYPSVDPYMGMIPGLKAFVAAVLGGIGSIPGAMLGGIILGLAETFSKGFISSKLADAIVFGILILILLVKPSGIMGKNMSEKV